MPHIVQLATNVAGVLDHEVPTDNPMHLGAPTLSNCLAPMFILKTVFEFLNHGVRKDADEIHPFLDELVPKQLELLS
jgi:hypothetical protein